MTIDTTATILTSALDSLVGNGKKFATPEDLAKGKLEADDFVEKLKTENKDLRNLVTAQDQRVTKLESKISILDRLNTNPNDDGNPGVQKVEPKTEPQFVGLSEDDVIKVVERAKNNEAANRNKTEVDSVLAKQFGAEAGAFLLQQSNSLGLAPDELKSLALRSPKAFYNLLGLNPNSNATSTTYTGASRTSLNATNEPIRNEAFYKAKQKELGNVKFVTNKALQVQMHRDMKQLGEEFFATA